VYEIEKVARLTISDGAADDWSMSFGTLGQMVARRRSAAILATLFTSPIVLTIFGLAFVIANYASQYGSGTWSSYSTGPNYAEWVVLAANAIAGVGTLATFICAGTSLATDPRLLLLRSARRNAPHLLVPPRTRSGSVLLILAAV
jgi:hypothetical protein